MGLRARAVMGLEAQAVSAWVNNHFVTIFSETCNNLPYKLLKLPPFIPTITLFSNVQLK